VAIIAASMAVKVNGQAEKKPPLVVAKNRKATLCLDDYDCIGFDLDHTLVR